MKPGPRAGESVVPREDEMANVRLLLWVVCLVLAGRPSVAAGDPESELHLIHTSEVRGTIGICG